MVEVEIIRKEESSKPFWLKFTMGVLLVGAGITVYVLKTTTDYSLKWPLIITGIIAVAFVISLFGKKLSDLLKHKKALEDESGPQPISHEQVEEIMDNEIDKMWNMKVIGAPVKKESGNINKSLIYVSQYSLLYDQLWSDGKRSNSCIIIVNATYPNIRPVVLPGYYSDQYVRAEMNRIALNPKDDPNEEETVEENPLLGTTRTTRKKIYQTPTKQDKKEAVI